MLFFLFWGSGGINDDSSGFNDGCGDVVEGCVYRCVGVEVGFGFGFGVGVGVGGGVVVVVGGGGGGGVGVVVDDVGGGSDPLSQHRLSKKYSIDWMIGI